MNPDKFTHESNEVLSTKSLRPCLDVVQFINPHVLGWIKAIRVDPHVDRCESDYIQTWPLEANHTVALAPRRSASC